MYKFDNGQISLEDFGQPPGMNLENSHRWVKLAQTIPWNEIEKNTRNYSLTRKAGSKITAP